MKTLKNFLLCSLIILVTQLNFFATLTSAQTIDELDRQLKEKQDKIRELESKLNDARQQEKTLKSQLDFIDGQTTLTELKIDKTIFEIKKLDKELEELDTRINRVSNTLDTTSEILLNRIISTYKYSYVTDLDLIFAARKFSDILDQIKYMQVIQAYDKKKLYELHATKQLFNDQKVDKETRQKEQERAKKQLEVYQKQLEEQKKAKAELLKATQNDEAKYQNLIKQIQAEIASISQAISNIGAKIGPVKKGEIIAGMGSTGCSTGPHLHYEVFENAKVEGGRIVGNRTSPKPFLESNRLGPPVRGYPDETTITTEYGEVYHVFGFASAHTGLDIAPKVYEGVGRAILASADGVAYNTQAPCNYNIKGGSSVGKGVIIDHQNGIVTLYWHIL